MFPQATSPEPLVWRACEPVHVTTLERVNVEENRPVPITSRVWFGLVVPRPIFEAKYALPVVVDRPFTVSPPVALPLPMVDEAFTMIPIVLVGVRTPLTTFQVPNCVWK